MRATAVSRAGVGWKSAARRRRGSGPESAPQAPPAPCAPALRLQASQTSDRLPGFPPLPAPRALTSAAGCPGLLALAGKVDCLGRLLLHLGWVSRAGRKQACVEFLFDPHGGINRKRRAPRRRAPHLPLLWAPRSTDGRRFPGTPARCAVWARLGARPVSTLWGRQQALCALTSCGATESICLLVFKLCSVFFLFFFFF